MSERNDIFIVEDIVEAITKVETFIAGMHYETFLNDAKTIDAVLMNIIFIGECIGRLSENFKDHHEKIDWFRIRGMRNRVAHDYKGVNLELVWLAVTEDLKELKRRLEKIL